MDKLTLKEKYLFATQLETVLSSGMSIIEGLDIMSGNSDDKIAAISNEIKEKMENGVSLNDAIKNDTRLDKYFVKMMEIGEMNGHLDTVTKELGEYYDRQDYLQRKVKEAVTYPIVLLWMMFAILLLLVTKILPVFNNIMNKMGVSFSGISLVLNRISKVLIGICLVALCIITVLSIVYFIYLKVTKDDSINEKILEKIPMTRSLYKTIGISKLTYALSLFVSSGYPLEEAVVYIDGITDNKELNNALSEIKEKIRNNVSFVDAINDADIYNNTSKGLLTIGLKSGRQEETFKKLVEIYDEEINEKTGAFLNIVEPVVIAVLSFVVGIALISIMLPLISIMGSLA